MAVFLSSTSIDARILKSGTVYTLSVSVVLNSGSFEYSTAMSKTFFVHNGAAATLTLCTKVVASLFEERFLNDVLTASEPF